MSFWRRPSDARCRIAEVVLFAEDGRIHGCSVACLSRGVPEVCCCSGVGAAVVRMLTVGKSSGVDWHASALAVGGVATVTRCWIVQTV